MTTQRPPVRALRHQLPDHASHSDARGIAIDKVGIKGLSWPITVWDRADGMQHTVADIEATVALPADVKGTHMSRFVEVLNNLNTGAAGSELSLKNLPDLLAAMQHRLGAERAQLDANFPYFLQRCAPVSGAKSLSSYRCGFHAEREAEEFRFELRVEVPVTTLCPCSKAVSERGAHNQRGYVRVRVRSTGMLWIEDVVEAVEAVASAPLYSLLKREDEKFVTEQAYDNPVFVEDLLRESVRVLQAHAAGGDLAARRGREHRVDPQPFGVRELDLGCGAARFEPERCSPPRIRRSTYLRLLAPSGTATARLEPA